MNKALIKIEKITALLAVFFLPSQLAYHFWPSTSFVYGFRIDFLSPAIYFSDLLIIASLLLLIINDRKILNFIKKNKSYLLIFLVFLLLNTALSSIPAVSLYKWFKYSEYIFWGIYVYLRKDFLGLRNILKTFLSSSVLISLIGIMQFFLKRTSGIFYLLGERSFSTATPGISLVSLNGQQFLRSYSTFSHPNSLAGYLGVVILIFLLSKILKRKTVWYLSILILLLGFLLTFSMSAFIAFGILLAAYILRKTKIFDARLLPVFLLVSIIASLVLPIYSEKIINSLTLPKNISERIELSYISGKMAGQNFLMGEGLNTFIVNSVKFKGVNIYSWLLQPVHNVFLLTLTELGISGLIFITYLLNKLINLSIKNKNYLIIFAVFFILFTGLSDHYWLTLQQNSLIISFLLGLAL